MPKFIFDAPADHVLEGDEINPSPTYGGQPFEVSDKYAEFLLANPGVVAIRNVPAELSKLSRPALDEIARERGLDPANFPNKEALIEILEKPEPSDHIASGEEEPVNPDDNNPDADNGD